MTPFFAWLPDHQLGVAATLAHADEVIGQISELLFDYQSQAGGVFALEEQLAFPRTRTVVTHIAPIPRKVPLLVADALVALRAALEHALFAETNLHDGPLDRKAARLVEMPAALTAQDFAAWTTARVRNGPASLRPGAEVVKRIETLQPFNRNDAAEHPLARLVLHTNHAKHRTPAVTAVRIAAMYEDHRRPRSIHQLAPRPEVPLGIGDVIAETPLGVQVPITLFPTVGINRPGTDRWPVLMNELDEIAAWVRTQAVPRLITGHEPPEPALPAHYAIAVGHDDERSAIARGSTLPAAERHAQRMVAASARSDLADLVALASGALHLEPIPEAQTRAWLASLDDAAVVERTLQLRQTADGQAVTPGNFRVLRDLHAEAAAWARRDAQTAGHQDAGDRDGIVAPDLADG